MVVVVVGVKQAHTHVHTHIQQISFHLHLSEFTFKNFGLRLESKRFIQVVKHWDQTQNYVVEKQKLSPPPTHPFVFLWLFFLNWHELGECVLKALFFSCLFKYADSVTESCLLT